MTYALVVDDEPAICQCFETLFSELRCDVAVTASAEGGLELLRDNQFDIIVLDVRLPGMDGLTALSQFQSLSNAPIIVMTARGTLSTAVSAVEEGAFEYLPKPFNLTHVTQVLKRAITESSRRTECLPESLPEGTASNELVGDSLPMQHLYRQIALAAQHDAPVLITGESGTGKELVAHAIHHHSPRRAKPLVAVHLASLSEALLERELFGHTTGAFTGAGNSQSGVIARADQGTLFLDEIGETPRNFQVKLLRTIESGDFYPVGSANAENSNFRLMAATNVPIDVLRSSDRFRADFFYRLATIQIRVPSLKEHPEDIPQLANHFLLQHTSNSSRQFTPAAMAALQERHFPGNVRELRNTVIRAATESNELAIDVEGLSVSDASSNGTSSSSSNELRDAAQQWATRTLAEVQSTPLITAAEIVESELIATALKQTNGNRSAAAKLLGIHRETLREKLARMSRPAEPE